MASNAIMASGNRLQYITTLHAKLVPLLQVLSF